MNTTNGHDSTTDHPYGRATLRAVLDDEIGEVVLQGIPTGPAGAVEVEPAPDLLCIFDAATGLLSEVSVGPCDNSGRFDVDRRTAVLLDQLFGSGATTRLVDVGRRGESSDLSANPVLQGQLFCLGVLDIARASDPVAPDSPLWAGEAALVAHRAGLRDLARLEARDAAPRLAAMLDSRPGLVSVEQVAAIVELLPGLVADEFPREAELLRRLSENRLGPAVDDAMAAMASERMLRGAGVLASAAGMLATTPFLDLQVLAAHTFLLAEDPAGDLEVEQDRDSLVLRVALDRRAERDAVRSTIARLVDPSSRSVVAKASFDLAEQQPEAGGVAIATMSVTGEIPHTSRLEVVDDAERPVAGDGLFHLSRALRYGQSALRSTRHPRGLHPRWSDDDFEERARNFWSRCASDWGAAGDDVRSELARARSVFQTADETELPDWARIEAAAPLVRQPAFLVEMLGIDARGA
jgi:hypothetical protein